MRSLATHTLVAVCAFIAGAVWYLALCERGMRQARNAALIAGSWQ